MGFYGANPEGQMKPPKPPIAFGSRVTEKPILEGK
jgi:hypothetical protein